MVQPRNHGNTCRQSFRESLGIDLEEHAPLIDQSLEQDLQTTLVVILISVINSY